MEKTRKLTLECVQDSDLCEGLELLSRWWDKQDYFTFNDHAEHFVRSDVFVDMLGECATNAKLLMELDTLKQRVAGIGDAFVWMRA